MAQFEQSTVDPNSTRRVKVASKRETAAPQRSGMLPLIAVLCALAFVASAWFFYHQGQRDALALTTIPASPSNESPMPAEPAQLAADGTPATTMVQTPSYGQPDIIVTVHPAAQDQATNTANSKPAKATRHVTKSRTMIAVTTNPLERQVALASRPQLAYPSQALRAGEQGTVLVLAQVDVNGQVSDTRVVRRSGSNILDHAASNEVRRWKFAPALHDGHAVVASVEVPVNYRLDQ